MNTKWLEYMNEETPETPPSSRCEGTSFPAWPGEQSRALSPNGRGGWTPLRPLRGPGLISFRMDWLDLLAVQGTLKSLLQHQGSIPLGWPWEAQSSPRVARESWGWPCVQDLMLLSREDKDLGVAVVLEKTLESPLDCKEIQPVHPKGDKSWVFNGRTDVEAETPILC